LNSSSTDQNPRRVAGKKTHSNDFRRVVTDPVYQAVFSKMVLARETDSEIHTTQRGRRYATSIQGTLLATGRRAISETDSLYDDWHGPLQ
jgi:hypothetical protein